MANRKTVELALQVKKKSKVNVIVSNFTFVVEQLSFHISVIVVSLKYGEYLQDFQ